MICHTCERLTALFGNADRQLFRSQGAFNDLTQAHLYPGATTTSLCRLTTNDFDRLIAVYGADADRRAAASNRINARRRKPAS